MLAVLLALGLSETHPKFTWQECTKSGCTAKSGYIVHDKHIAETRNRDQYGDLDYEKDVGVTVSGGTVKQRLVSPNYQNYKVIGSRLYIVDADDKYYQLFTFIGKEFTYTVDMSEIPCGVNAALYTVEMPKAGKTPGGVEYGYGYCDANSVDGDSCAEFDIQEASSKAIVYTSHACSSQTSGCDTSGCGYNPYRDSNDHAFWGTTINVNQPVTIVTQFIGSGSSLTEVKRLYVQGGKVTEAAKSLTADGCCNNIRNIGPSFARGHVVVFSLWDSNGMSWMDGGNAGPCTSYNIDNVEKSSPNLKVTWSNIKYGDIDSTY
uniref:cellulase n=1 Tax=uncultured symbiotic protist of Neotermes koshunensis TaxID=403660 RepID=A4UWY2_9EUKA|nr:putative glycosyl hydrolase family7 [uncultured symbiotic protist of Neotermes koshunensis]